MSDFNPETRPGERWWEMLSLKPHCQGGQPYTPPPWYHDYTTQIELEKFKRGFIQFIGHPLVIVRGKRYTVQEMAGLIGCKVDTFTLHLMRGAVRFKDLSWDVDLDEYSARVDAYKAKIMEDRRIKLEAAEAEKRASELRLLASRMANAERLRSMHQKRREAFYSQFTITAREDKPGKLRILYVNGARSSKAEACKILGFGEVVLLKQLKKGNFTFQGHTVEVRYSDPQAFKEQRNKARREERARAREDREQARKIERERIREEKAAAAKERRRLYDQKRQAAKRATAEKKKSGPKPKIVFTWEPYPVPPNNKKAVLYFRGEKLPEARTKELTGFGRDKCFDLARKGRCFFPDGSVLEYIEDGSRGFKGITEDGPKIQPAGKIKGKQRYQVRIMMNGKRIVLSTSVDLKVLEQYLSEILVDEKWKSILDKKQGLG